MKIGAYHLESPFVFAPMAGISDAVMRKMCRDFGASMAVSEMVGADVKLYTSAKTKRRLQTIEDEHPRSVQIVGYDPVMMAQAAIFNVDNGAQIIDINMGCPAKKVCNKLAGSALLKDEPLVAAILEQVVNAVDVPVTLKIRTGWDVDNKNAVSIAKLAENIGIQALAVHGRTRACRFKGAVEYDTIKAVKAAVNIPVIANGDIDTPEKAQAVLDYTKANAVMIGRGAQGQPWIFKKMLAHAQKKTDFKMGVDDVHSLIKYHLEQLYQLYGDVSGVRIARKHLSWYARHLNNGESFRREFNILESAKDQITALDYFFEHLEQRFIH